jgi:hypothetical protein
MLGFLLFSFDKQSLKRQLHKPTPMPEGASRKSLMTIFSR